MAASRCEADDFSLVTMPAPPVHPVGVQSGQAGHRAVSHWIGDQR
jgi:hypothetical protein